MTSWITKFGEFFSRAFWFGSFLPGALFALIHLMIAWAAFGDRTPLVGWLKEDASKPTTFFFVVIGLLIALGYVLSPMASLLRDLLDGSLLPRGVQNWLREARMPAVRAVRREVDEALRLRAGYESMVHDDFGVLREARDKGNTTRNVNHGSIEAIARKIDAFAESIAAGDIPTLEQLVSNHDELARVLRANRSDLKSGVPQGRSAQRLDQARETFIDIIGACERDVSYQLTASVARSRRMAYLNPQSTRMADARILAEDYSRKAFDVDFDYLWPRLLAVLPDQGNQKEVGSYNDRLIGARARVDFAVLSTVLAGTIAVVWVPLLIACGTSIPLFLAVGLFGPLAVLFFYQMAVEAQFAFGDAVKSAIDKYRFDVLVAQRLPLPPTLAAERELWAELRVVEQLGEATDLFYRHPKQPG